MVARDVAIGCTLIKRVRPMGDDSYGLQHGQRADCVILPGDTPTEAVMEQPVRTYVLKGGQLVAANGQCLV